MEGNKSKRVGFSVLSGWVNNITKIVFPFINRTIVIYYLGIQYIGLSSLFSSILGVLSLAELGFDTSIMYLMYDAVAIDDAWRIGRYQSYLKRVYKIIGSMILFVGLLMIPFVKYLVKDNSSLPDRINLETLYILFLINSVSSYFFGGYKQGLLKCYQRNDIIYNFDTFFTFLLSVIQVFALIIFKDYYIYTIVRAAVTIAENLSIKYRAKNLFPNIKEVGTVDKEEKNEIKKLVYGNFLSKVGGVLSTSFDNAICSVFLGVTILGYYSNYIYISNAIVSFLIIIYASLQGAIGNDLIIKSKQENLDNLYTFSFMYIWLSIWCAFVLYFMTPEFIVLWIRKRGILPSYVLVAIVINFYFVIFNSILGIYKEAAGIFWEDRYRGIISGVINLTLNIIFALTLKKYGDYYVLLGIVISTTISMLLVSIPWSIGITFKEFFCTSPKGFCLFLLKMTSVFVILLGMGIFISNFIGLATGRKGVVNLIIRGCICMVLPNLFMAIVFRRDEQFIKSFHFVKQRLIFVKNNKQ